MELSDQLVAYQSNAWPAMVADLAQDLGVSAASLHAIGIGWMPLDGCWVFPERDAEGRVIGLVRRFKDGKKFSVEGSKRGLTYALSPDYNPQGEAYVSGSHNWTRCSEDYPCPLCGKTDWCLVSSEDPADPKAVICGRTAAGATQPLGESGYLHIRKAAGKLSSIVSILGLPSLPILIVEGQSDVAAAFALGFPAVGKPSASSGLAYLTDLLTGYAVVVLGENDAGAGRLGMEKTFETLKPKAKSVVKLMPPEGIKDLRAWVRAGLTQEALLAAIEQTGEATSDSEMLESIAPMDIAQRWLRERHWDDSVPLIRMYADNWYRFGNGRYEEKPKTWVRGDLYAFLKGKTAQRFSSKGEAVIEPYIADSHKVSDILDTLSMNCPVYADAPCWLDDETHPASQDIIGFRNCLLTVPDLVPRPSTPQFFSLVAMPYDYDPDATCPTWLQAVDQIFAGDQEKTDLLQEWFGYNSVADTSLESFIFFVGRPGAGKGTVISGLHALLGQDQVASTSFDHLVGDFGLKPLVGKLAAIMGDAHMTRRSDPEKALQVLKEITGQDRVAINQKNKEFLSNHKLPCRFTISVNAMPDLPDHERSLDRRLLLLHFGECFVGREDRGLKERIAAEAPGIAVWAIQGLLRLRRQGFTVPASSKPVIEEFRKQSSPATEFADENCAFNDDFAVPSLALYDAFAHWCKDQGAMIGTHTRFTQRFLLLYPGLHIERMTLNGKQVRCFVGVRLTDEAVERYLVGRR